MKITKMILSCLAAAGVACRVCGFELGKRMPLSTMPDNMLLRLLNLPVISTAFTGKVIQPENSAAKRMLRESISA